VVTITVTVAHGHHPAVAIYLYVAPSFGRHITPQVTKGQFGKFLFLIENYKSCADFDRTARNSVWKNAATERTSFLRER